MMPNNPLVGGTSLRRPAVQSPNYVAGSAGWSINSDGSAEFSNATIRGQILGSDVELNQNGAFFYAGTPAAGNLVLSLADANGNDEYGNSYLAGVSVYDPTNGQTVQLIEGGVQMINGLDTFLMQANTTTDELDITCSNGSMTLALAPALLTLTGGPTQVDELLVYGGVSGTITKNFPSSGTLVVPAGVTTMRRRAWAAGAGGGSGGGGGGGGGEYAEEPATSTVVPGNTVTVTVGSAGTGGASGGFHDGTAGGNTTISSPGSTTVTAHGGSKGLTSGSQAAGGTGSTNTIHHNGGSSGTSSGSRGGGGGGGAGGPTGAGGTGGNATPDRTPGDGGAAGTGGGATGGGSGGGYGSTVSGGSTGITGGGTGGNYGGAGGGGGYNGSTAASSAAGGPGAKGYAVLTYTITSTALVAGVAGAAGTDPVNSSAYPAGAFGLHAGTDYATLADNGSHAALLFGAAGGAADITLTRALAKVLSSDSALAIPSTGTPAAIAGTAILWVNVNGTLCFETAAGELGAILGCQQSQATTTVGNTATAGAITASWTIPAGDFYTGTEYVIETLVTGTMEASTLNIGMMIDGSFTNLVPIPAGGGLTAGHAIVGQVRVHFKCTSTGTSGNLYVWADGTLQDGTVNRSASVTVGVCGANTGVTINTTTSHTLAIGAKWSATATGETISGNGSSIRRVGN